VNQWTVVGPPIQVRAMAVDPHNPDLLYAAGDEMAARSDDRGATWTLSPTPGLHVASAVRVAVSMPSTIYALGSSELYRSTNGGISWTRRKVAKTPQFQTDLQVDARNADVLVTAAWNFCFLGCSGGGVFRSDDGGGSWRGIGFKDQSVHHVALDPVRSQLMYATTDTGLFKTTDGGRSWRDISPAGTGSFHVAIDPVAPTTIYASAQPGVFRSDNSGESWELIRPYDYPSALATPEYGARLLFSTAGGAAVSMDQGRTWVRLSTAGSGLTLNGLWQLAVGGDTYYMVSDLQLTYGQVLAYELRQPRRRAVRSST
jgi:photosystem II stability/assembly factor-like uncharacterized protein